MAMGRRMVQRLNAALDPLDAVAKAATGVQMISLRSTLTALSQQWRDEVNAALTARQWAVVAAKSECVDQLHAVLASLPPEEETPTREERDKQLRYLYA